MARHRSRSRSTDSVDHKRRKQYAEDDRSPRPSKDLSSRDPHKDRSRDSKRSRASRDGRQREYSRDRDVGSRRESGRTGGDRERDRERDRDHRQRNLPASGPDRPDSPYVESSNGNSFHHQRSDETVSANGRGVSAPRSSVDAMQVDASDARQSSNGQMHSTGRVDVVRPIAAAKSTSPVKTVPQPPAKAPTAAEDEELAKARKRARLEQWKKDRLAAKEAAAKSETPEASVVPSANASPAPKGATLPSQTVAPIITAPTSVAATVVKPPLSGTPKTAKPVARMAFGKPGKTGMSIKPTTLTAKPVAVKRKSAFGMDDDDEEDSRLSKLPTRKLKIMGPDDMEVDETQQIQADDGTEDTLDAFMTDVSTEVQRLTEQDLAIQEDQAAAAVAAAVPTVEGENDEEDDDSGNASDNPEDLIAAAAKKLAAKRKDLAPVDHSTQNYEHFRKDFYIEPPEIASMTEEEVEIKRLDLDGIKIRGVKCPKPIEKWTHFGLPTGVGDVIRKVLKYDKPSSIQAQAIPAIMSGRDVIGIAKTGSGKTIAFLLPMFRHIKDQRPLENMEGPVALIMTPTRELAVQIHKECKHFAKAQGLRAVCCYGGSPIKDQIAELKRGAEIIIGTPGRMIDLLCANSGRVTNLRRVTYLVLDEADRMFDMGFEPQVMRIVNNVRPSRQTILFSATFPRKMEALARKILRKPLEITVGARSVVASDVTQIVEVVPDENAKFLRLLEILGRTFNEDENAKILIFTDRQEAADNLLTQLLRKGYPCQSLHGGKDQSDRDSTIADFKSGSTNVLIATSVAARGLDVKQLKVVINHECPNHMEDYVHRVGRTGRAGNKGTAYTFITPDQDRFAVDIIKALVMSEVPVPDDLQKLGDSFVDKVKLGAAQYHSSGFGGKGLERLEMERDVVKRIQKKAHGGQFEEEGDEEEEEEVKFEAKAVPPNSAPPKDAVGANSSATAAATVGPNVSAAVRAAQEAAAKVNAAVGSGTARARDIIAEINAKFNGGALAHAHVGGVGGEEKKQASEAAFAYEIEINDYPQKARWRVTNREQISQITELSGAAITTRGTFFTPGKQPGPNERKLYLFIEGDTQLVIDKAKVEIKRIITEATIAAMESEAAGGARYSVV